jgi:glycosyl transferase family 87
MGFGLLFWRPLARAPRLFRSASPGSGRPVLGLARTAVSVLIFGVVPAALLIGTTAAAIHEGTVAFDFEHAFLPAARAVIHGQNPYVAPTSRALHDGTAFVYPPVAAVLFTPFAVLSPVTAGLLVSGLCLLCAFLTLAVLGVRDWRCYGVLGMWAPVFSSVHVAAISTLLALLIAIAWRWRRSPWVAGVAVGLALALKLFLWPLLLWLCAVRYWRTAAVAAASTLFFVAVPWAAIGFAGLASYPHMLSELSSVEASEGYTVAAALSKLGLSWQLGQLIGLLAAFLCGAAMLAAGRAGRARTALTLAIGLALLASPIVWMHYFALLVVVVALYVPRLTFVWLLPVGLLLLPIQPGVASGWMIAAALATVAAVAVMAASSGAALPGRRPSPERLPVPTAG